MDFMHLCLQVTLLKGSGVNWWSCSPGWNSGFSGWEDWIGMKLCWVNISIFASKHKSQHWILASKHKSGHWTFRIPNGCLEGEKEMMNFHGRVFLADLRMWNVPWGVRGWKDILDIVLIATLGEMPGKGLSIINQGNLGTLGKTLLPPKMAVRRLWMTCSTLNGSYFVAAGSFQWIQNTGNQDSWSNQSPLI